MKSKPNFITGYAQSAALIVEELQRGCVIAGDTDTVPGLLAPLSERGFKSLNLIKGRFEKPYLVLTDSPEKLTKFVDFPLDPYVRVLIEQCWPGPLTIIFKAKAALPSYIKSVDGTIAIRIPKHAGLLKVLARTPWGVRSDTPQRPGHKSGHKRNRWGIPKAAEREGGPCG